MIIFSKLGKFSEFSKFDNNYIIPNFSQNVSKHASFNESE